MELRISDFSGSASSAPTGANLGLNAWNDSNVLNDLNHREAVIWRLCVEVLFTIDQPTHLSW
jgi:hypothetical protein